MYGRHRPSPARRPPPTMDPNMHHFLRSRSPPPPYDTIYPSDSSSTNKSASDDDVFRQTPTNSQMTQTAKWRSEEKSRRLRTRSSGTSGSYSSRLYVDDISLHNHRINSRRLASGHYQDMKEIDVFCGDPSHRYGRSESSSSDSSVLCRRRERGSTFVSLLDDADSPEYALLPPLTQLEAKTAIHGHVTRHWYNGKSSNRISIICIKTASTWHYDITTVIETRREINAETPYQGPIGGNRGDVRPSLWEMKIPIPNDHHRKRVKIPSTSSLSECDSCSGRGFVTCSNCSGSGRDSCYHCGESGHITVHESRSEYNTMTGQTLSRMHPRSECCHYCSGAGYSECVYCRGRRKNSCRRCKETGQVEKFKQAEVTWTTKQDHHFKNPTHVDLTEESLHKCKGVVVFENQNERSEPITTRDCLNSEMVLASKHLTKRHKIIPSGAQIRQQRQRISLIPVYKVVCHKGSKLKTYFVAGTNRKVFSRSSSVNNVSSVDCCIL